MGSLVDRLCLVTANEYEGRPKEEGRCICVSLALQCGEAHKI